MHTITKQDYNVDFTIIHKRCYFTHFEVKLEPTTRMKQYTERYLQEIANTCNFNSCQLNWFPMAVKFAKGSDKNVGQGNEANRLGKFPCLAGNRLITDS